jgi:hypothetical protein
MVEQDANLRDDEQMNDPTVYEQENQNLANDYEFEFSVKNPQDNGGHITYDVRGRDRTGQFECKRRYNDFFTLWEVMTKRFPGIPIPIPPPKKAIGNKDLTFVQDRTFYLQRFLRKLARFDFIIESPEFQAFARPITGFTVERGIQRLLPMSTAQLYDRIKAITDIEIESMDFYTKESFNAKITSVLFFVK